MTRDQQFLAGTRNWALAGALLLNEERGLAPFDDLDHLHRVITGGVDPALRELCRLRIATLLRDHDALSLRSPDATALGLTEKKIAAVPEWPSSKEFSPLERACLAFAEQFVLDVGLVTDDLTNALLEHMTPTECYAFVNAVWITEVFQRSCLTLDLDHDVLVERLSRSDLAQLKDGDS